MLAADDRLARKVGALAITGVALATVFFVVIAPRIAWSAKLRIVVTFQASGGLREGAPFVVAGKPIGRVEQIAFADAGVRVTVAFDASAARALRHGGDIFVTSRGIVSERYLEIGPAPPNARPLRDGDIIAGIDPPTLDQALQRSWSNLVTASDFAAAVEPEARALRTELAALRATLAALPSSTLRDALVALAVETRTTDFAPLGSLGGDTTRTLAQARATIGTLRTSALALRAGLHGLRGRELVAHVDTAIDRTRRALDDADALLAEVDSLHAMIANQEGSLMRLLHDPELPEETKEIGKVLKRTPWKVIARPADD